MLNNVETKVYIDIKTKYDDYYKQLYVSVSVEQDGAEVYFYKDESVHARKSKFFIEYNNIIRNLLQLEKRNLYVLANRNMLTRLEIIAEEFLANTNRGNIKNYCKMPVDCVWDTQTKENESRYFTG